MHKELIYSFNPVIHQIDWVHVSPELAPLTAIQAKLAQAAANANARRYQEAIEAYQSAHRMILGHLTAKKQAPIATKAPQISQELFMPLLSASAEWLNVLPVVQPDPGVRSRMDFDHSLLEGAVAGAATGLFSEELATEASMGALADLQQAVVMENAGNAAAASFFRNRAQTTDATTFTRYVEGMALEEGATTRVTAADIGPLSALSRFTTVQDASLAGVAANYTEALAQSAQLTTPVDISNAGRSLTMLVGQESRTLSWQPQSGPPLDQIITSVYEARRDFLDIVDLVSLTPALGAAALHLPHSCYYVIPLGLAECYRGLGDYANAEKNYLNAADYEYLNHAIEAPFVWLRLAETYVLWGNDLYLADEAALARQQYEKVLDTSQATTSRGVFSTGLAAGADAARAVIGNLEALLDGSSEASALGVNPAIVATVLEAHENLVRIDAGLDYWGHSTTTVPIWSYDHLHDLAVRFTQLAIAAERDFIQFQERSDQGALSRVQLRQQVTVARAETAAARQQVAAAEAEVAVQESAVSVSAARADSAWAHLDDFTASTAQAQRYRAIATWVSGGERPGDVNAYADLITGRPRSQTEPSRVRYNKSGHLVGSNALMSAVYSLLAERVGTEFEARSLERQAQELELVTAHAEEQLKASRARTKAVEAAAAAARARETAAREVLAAFDDQFFTPQVWARMADTVRGLARRYLQMAIRTARLMQRAYNVETDQDLDVIKLNYSAGGSHGLLAADLLMADIQGFAFDLVTSTRTKPQPLRATISLATQHPLAFETQLRRTGAMDFQTLLEEFDEVYPGTYNGRIEAIEVAIDGIIPPRGISGTLTNEGFSHYRRLLPDGAGDEVRTRVQASETLVLSDHDIRTDSIVNPADQRMLRVFEGAGLASSWRLQLPPQLNDIDYATLTDVRITFHYRARFDPTLHRRMLADLAARPGADEREIALPLRWLYPDAFFSFYQTGNLEIPIERSMFPANQLDPKVTSVGLILVTAPSTRAPGTVLEVTPPGDAPVTVTTDETGAALPEALSALDGGPLYGTWRVSLPPEQNPAWTVDERLALDAVANLVLVLGYSFTRRTEPT